MLIRPKVLMLAALPTLGQPALAAPKKGDPNPPNLTSNSEGAARAWAKRYISDEDDFGHFVADDPAAYLLRISTFQVKDTGPFASGSRKRASSR